MKKLRENINQYLDHLDKRWLSLPIHKQHLYTLYFFVFYLLLTVGVIAKVCYEVGRSESKMSIEHIENPVLKKNVKPASLQDTLTILNKQLYGK